MLTTYARVLDGTLLDYELARAAHAADLAETLRLLHETGVLAVQRFAMAR